MVSLNLRFGGRSGSSSPQARYICGNGIPSFFIFSAIHSGLISQSLIRDRSPNTLSRKLFFSKNIGELSSAVPIFSSIMAEERPAIYPNVSWYFRPFRIAPYPPIDNPAINVSSFLWDNGNILRVIFTSSFPINSL